MNAIWELSRYNDNIAIIDEVGNKLKYSELDHAGQELANIINGRCLVFCMCTNSIGSILGYASFVNNGIVPVMINAHMEDALRDNLINAYYPKFIWSPIEIAQKLCSDCDGFKIIYDIYEYALVATGYMKQYPLYDDLCLLLTTSGSTGSPKFVRQSYVNVKSNAQAIVDYLEIDASERPITTLPMNYTYGLSIINSHLLVGATILVTDKGLMQKEFWNFFRNEGATSFGGVPYTYEMLERLRFSRMDLPSLRYMTQAGGKITPELHARFAEYAASKNIKFIVMYGQTDATARMSYLPAEK